jgi:hypothetical protein
MIEGEFEAKERAMDWHAFERLLGAMTWNFRTGFILPSGYSKSPQ